MTQDTIIIDRLVTDKTYADLVFKQLYEKVEEDFDFRNQKIPVQYGKQKYEWKVSQIQVNIILWEPFLLFDSNRFDEGFFMDTSNITAGDIDNYHDRIIETFIESVSTRDINLVLAHMQHRLNFFSNDFNAYIGNTMNLEGLIQLAEENEEFFELIHTKYEENMPTNEIEQDIDKKRKRVLEILGSTDNPFLDYIEAEEGVNSKQLSQYMISVGPKPDIEDNVFPKIVNTNFLTDGLLSASDYYIDSSGGRLAAIMNATEVKTSGYNTRKLSLLCLNTNLSDTIKDCKTKNYMIIEVDSDKTLKRLNGRYFLHKDKLVKLNPSKHKALIGKKIKLRSPMTCASKDGNICHTCYGHLSKINYDVHAGILAVSTLAAQLTQMLLSTKHLLETRSEKIEWDKNFRDTFSVHANAITVNSESDSEFFVIRVDQENIIEDNDDRLLMSEFELEVYTSKKESTTYPIKSEKNLYFSDALIKYMERNSVHEDGVIEINMKNFDYNESVFFIEVENSGLTVHLNNILKLIDRKDMLNITTKEEMHEKFLELVNNSGFHIDSVHIECIMRELLRDPEHITKRPDWSTPDTKYQIIHLSEANMQSPSVVTSLSFEKIKSQLLENPDTYKKHEVGTLDAFFK